MFWSRAPDMAVWCLPYTSTIPQKDVIFIQLGICIACDADVLGLSLGVFACKYKAASMIQSLSLSRNADATLIIGVRTGRWRSLHDGLCSRNREVCMIQ